MRIPAGGIETFQAYESLVLPLLPQHGATLDRRLRNGDGTVEIHLMTFPSTEALDAYRANPVRLGHMHLLKEAGAVPELLEVGDVTSE